MNLIERAKSLATKTVRHVRTPEGAEMYGQPIGSVIVADAVPTFRPGIGVLSDVQAERYNEDWTPRERRKAKKVPSVRQMDANGKPGPPPQTRGMKHLWDIESDLDGYEMVVDSRNVKFYVVQDSEYGFSVWDSNDYFVTSGKTKAAALKSLDEMVAPNLKPNMHWATAADRKRLVIAPGWRDVMVSDDPKTRLQAIGYDYKGGGQYVYTVEHRQIADAEKFARMKAMAPKLKKLDAALKKNVGDETNDCLMMIRTLGMRPDTGGDGTADIQTFGATSLQARHVKVSDSGIVTLTFIPGKKRVPVTIKVRDKALADMLRERLKTRTRNDPMFKTDAEKLSKMLKGVVGDAFMVKDLRTIRANAIALSMIQKKQGVPQSQAEFRKWKREVATAVSEILGNTPTIALKSYINNAVFADWQGDPSWT